MKFIISSSLLLKQLQSISGVLNTNNTLPILDNFLFDLQGEELSISASDLETTMTAKVAVSMADEFGKVAIPAKILLETLKTFSDVPITFTIDPDNNAIEISAGEGKYKLSGQNGDEFPKIPEIEGAANLELNASIIYNSPTQLPSKIKRCPACFHFL